MWHQLIEDFVTLWVVIDPIGTIPVFIAVTRHQLPEERTKTAIKAIGYTAAILLFFLCGGQLLLDALKIPLPSFQIAGGLVLFLFALTMIFGEGKPAAEQLMETEEGTDVAVFPLAVPSLASPGAMMAVVVLTDNRRFDLLEQLATASVMLAILGVTLLLLMFANTIKSIIGNAGASIVSRVMGLILAAVATEHVLSAINVYFGIRAL